VEEGFFGPTNKDNAIGVPKKRYLQDNPLSRPNFAKKLMAAKPDNLPRPVGRPPINNLPKEKGHPSKYAHLKLPREFALRRPKDYFDLFLSLDFVNDNILKTTNARAAAEGAGSVTYQDFVPFSVQEIYKFIGLLFANSVSPKPLVIYWFLSTNFGNDPFAKLFDKVTLTGKVISGLRRWKQLRRFLACYDFQKYPKQSQKDDPLWKVASVLEHLRKNCQRCWVPGKFVSINEQTIGFKGKHGLALRISYKREGDGYQCGALCERGYTFSFYFRHGDAPPAPKSIRHLDLSPTA
jgi:hypothetical protein